MRDLSTSAVAGDWIDHAMNLMPNGKIALGDLGELSLFINDIDDFGRMCRRHVLVTRQIPVGTERGPDAAKPDAVVILSRDCAVQTFPGDLSAEPIRLRAPVTPVAFRVALEHVANRLRTGRGAAHPGFA